MPEFPGRQEKKNETAREREEENAEEGNRGEAYEWMGAEVNCRTDPLTSSLAVTA